MQCPLCGGPLEVRNDDLFVCEVGHELDDDELRATASTRAMVALWMAIEALEVEADALNALAALGGDEDAGRLAAQATADAGLLRRLAGARHRGHDDEVDVAGG